MLREAVIMMVISVCYIYANDCDFELKRNEIISYAKHEPIVLACDPVYKIDTETCTITPLYKWIFQNKEIAINEGKEKLVSNDRKLIIFDGNKSDEGTYICDTNNNYGPLNTTFTVKMTEPSDMQRIILRNIFPSDPNNEIKGRLYWLLEMLSSNLQQTYVVKRGDSLSLFGAYYISADVKEIKNLSLQWFFHTDDVNLTNVLTLGHNVHQINSPCKDLDIIPRMVNGSCYNSQLHLSQVDFRNQGYYTNAAHLILDYGISQTLNFTYRININVVNIFESETAPLLKFNSDSKVCVNDYFEFNCKASPDGYYFTVIYKFNQNSEYTPLSESSTKKININNKQGKIYSKGMYITDSHITYSITSVKSSDSGIYYCKAIHSSLLNEDPRTRLETVERMEFLVNNCSDRYPYPVTVWSVISVCAVIIIVVALFLIYRYSFNYSKSYLVKTVIVQHPNKLYVPHDTCFPLILPDVTIKTTHKHRNRSENSLLTQNQFHHISNVPLSQKLSRYIRKSFIFNYRHVDTSGSSPDAHIVNLSNNDTNKNSTNSLKVEEPKLQLILQNDVHTKYILPSNIGCTFSREKLIVGSKIGEGAFGIVYSAVLKCDNTVPVEVAIKTLHTSFGDEDVVNLIQELEMMKMIGHHRHIIGLIGACVDNGHPYMVIDLAKHGNLRDFLRTRRGLQKLNDSQNYLTIKDLLRFSLEIAKGMQFLSSRMIIHRDLAARNVLVDQNFEMKIADFGLTRAVEHYYRKRTDGRLPIKWMAPECLLDRIYTVKSDVWSFGIVLWEIFTMGQTPYPTIQSDAMHQALRNGIRNEKPSLATDEIYRLMLTIWNDDPIDRYTFTELVDKLTDLELSEGSTLTQEDYLEISSNQTYSVTNV